MATYAQVRTAYRQLVDELEAPDELRRDFGHDVRRQAQRNATRRPTPQARGIAGSLRVGRKGTVFGLPSATVILSGRPVRAAGINYGAEYGSNRHAQFAPRRESGYWLNPAADQVGDVTLDRWLDEVVRDSFRGIR